MAYTKVVEIPKSRTCLRRSEEEGSGWLAKCMHAKRVDTPHFSRMESLSHSFHTAWSHDGKLGRHTSLDNDRYAIVVNLSSPASEKLNPCPLATEIFTRLHWPRLDRKESIPSAFPPAGKRDLVDRFGIRPKRRTGARAEALDDGRRRLGHHPTTLKRSLLVFVCTSSHVADGMLVNLARDLHPEARELSLWSWDTAFLETRSRNSIEVNPFAFQNVVHAPTYR